MKRTRNQVQGKASRPLTLQFDPQLANYRIEEEGRLSRTQSPVISEQIAPPQPRPPLAILLAVPSRRRVSKGAFQANTHYAPSSTSMAALWMFSHEGAPMFLGL